MAWLIVFARKVEIRRIFMEREWTVLGRDAGCDVVLDNRSVDRRHLEICRSGGRHFV